MGLRASAVWKCTIWSTAESKLANVSTRGFVGNGDDVMIVGAIVVGTAPRGFPCGRSHPADVGVS